MKRSVGALGLLAGLAGCLSTGIGPDGPRPMNSVTRAKEIPGVIAADGTPVPMTANDAEKARRKGLISDGLLGARPAAKTRASGGVITAGANLPANGPSGVVTADVRGKTGGGVQVVGHKHPQPIPVIQPAEPAGPPAVQSLGVPGQVAAVGAIVGPGPLKVGNARTSIRFAAPAGMKVAWYGPAGFGRNTLEVPGRYNFLQGGIYRLKLTDIPNRPGVELYPTLEVVPSNNRTATFLAHSSVPVVFTDEDFEQVAAGNFVVKVIYLPDPQFQDLAVAGPDEIVSSRLEPGVDPIVEATRRGSIMAVIRVGNIDLEAPNTPAMDAPSPYLGGFPGGPGLPPGLATPGAVPPDGRPPVPLPPPGPGGLPTLAPVTPR